jgi:putative ABC transport system permease protein
MGSGPWLTVVGIVGDIHQRGLDAPARTEMYRPHEQFRFGTGDRAPGVASMTWAVRTTGNDPTAVLASAREAIRRVDPDLAASEVQTLQQVVADATSDRRLNLMLFALLGGLALALAAVGVYGVVSYAVSERTHEIGVRMAVGARPADVARMVVSDGGRLAAAGIVVGLAIALAAGRVMRGFLFHVSPFDPATFASVAAALAVVALLASYIPARRATRVDPMIALRGE